jgi:hypothetical protein
MENPTAPTEEPQPTKKEIREAKKRKDEARKRNAKYLKRGKAPHSPMRGKSKKQKQHLASVFVASRPSSRLGYALNGRHTKGSKVKAAK